MLYGSNVWDPVLIIAQIISLQCLFYLSLGLWLTVLLAPYLGHITTAYVFDWHHITFKHFQGWLIIVANLSVSPMAALYLLWVVERAKKCLDYGSTIYILHFIATVSLHGFPVSAAWWLTNGLGLLVVALLGEWLCVRKEMQDIPLNSLRNNRAAANGTASGGSGGGPSGSSSSAPPTARERTLSPSSGRDRTSPQGAPTTVVGKLKLAVTGRQSASGKLVTSVGSGRGGHEGANRAISLQMTTLSGDRAAPLSRQNSKSRLLGGEEV